MSWIIRSLAPLDRRLRHTDG